MKTFPMVRILATAAVLVATAAGTGAAAANAQAAQDPILVLDVTTGPVGTEFMASGIGFLPNLPIRVSSPGLVEVGPPGENRADTYGNLNKRYRVAANTPPGYLTIEYRQAEKIIARTNFEVQRR